MASCHATSQSIGLEHQSSSGLCGVLYMQEPRAYVATSRKASALWSQTQKRFENRRASMHHTFATNRRSHLQPLSTRNVDPVRLGPVLSGGSTLITQTCQERGGPARKNSRGWQEGLAPGSMQGIILACVFRALLLANQYSEGQMTSMTHDRFSPCHVWPPLPTKTSYTAPPVSQRGSAILLSPRVPPLPSSPISLTLAGSGLGGSPSSSSSR